MGLLETLNTKQAPVQDEQSMFNETAKFKLSELESKIENNMLKNEESLAMAETLSELFGGLSKYSNSEHSELLLIYELDRISRRMEILFNMLSNQLEKNAQTNSELLEELSQIKSGESI